MVPRCEVYGIVITPSFHFHHEDGCKQRLTQEAATGIAEALKSGKINATKPRKKEGQKQAGRGIMKE